MRHAIVTLILTLWCSGSFANTLSVEERSCKHWVFSKRIEGEDVKIAAQSKAEQLASETAKQECEKLAFGRVAHDLRVEHDCGPLEEPYYGLICVTCMATVNFSCF